MEFIRPPSFKGKYYKFSAGVEANCRQNGVVIVKPIIYGNVACYLSKDREDGRTHQWTVYLRSYDNEDMSMYVKRVQFKLHNSYEEPNRIYTSPPYSLTETGWGEFEIVIKIFFVDSCERPVTLYHFLKLFDREKDGMIKQSNEPVNSEFYDELVFTDPTLRMFRLLTHPTSTSFVGNISTVDYESKKIQDLQKILDAKKKVKQEIGELKARLAEAKENIANLKSQVKTSV